MDYVFLLIGVALLIYSGNWLVKSSSSLASSLKIPPLIIGVTIVSFGTSAPELFVSLSAAFEGLSDVAIGNVVGSNIANLGLVLGLSAFIIAIPIKRSLIKLDYSILIISAIALGIFIIDYKISRIEGVILLTIMLIYVLLILKSLKNKGNISENNNSKIYKPSISILIIVASCVGLILGSNSLIKGAINIANNLGISERIISLSVIAVGTSLPELTTSVIAAIKKDFEISIGNVIGSNIFNSLFILGLSSLVTPLSVNESILKIDYFFMLGFFVLLGIFFFPIKRLRISRIEGLIFIIAYCFYYYVIFS